MPVFITPKALRTWSPLRAVSFGTCRLIRLTSTRLSAGGLCSRIGCGNGGMNLIAFVSVLMRRSINVLTYSRKAIQHWFPIFNLDLSSYLLAMTHSKVMQSTSSFHHHVYIIVFSIPILPQGLGILMTLSLNPIFYPK